MNVRCIGPFHIKASGDELVRNVFRSMWVTGLCEEAKVDFDNAIMQRRALKGLTQALKRLAFVPLDVNLDGSRCFYATGAYELIAREDFDEKMIFAFNSVSDPRRRPEIVITLDK